MEESHTPQAPAPDEPLLPGRLSAYDFFTAVWRLLAQARTRARETSATQPIAPGAGGPLAHEPLRLKVSPELSFPTAELAGLAPDPLTDVLNLTTFLPGLQGALSPLPPVYTAEVLHAAEEDPQLPGFLDLFHHRLLGLLYNGVVKSHPERMWQGDGQDDYSQILALLSSQDDALRLPDAPSGFRDFTGLLQSPHPTADGLELLLSRFLNHPVEVQPLLGQYVSLPDDALPRLGEHAAPGRMDNPFRLGHSLLGTRVFDRSQCFGVLIEVDSWSALTRLAPGGEQHTPLIALIRQYVGALLDIRLSLKLPASEAPAATLGGECPATLGQTLPLGELETSFLELHYDLRAT